MTEKKLSVKDIDFNVPQLLKLSDSNYFSIGSVDLFDHENLVLSASTLKNIFARDAYDVLINKNNQDIDDELQYIFDVGSSFHAFCLENEHFEKRYYVADYKNAFESEHRTFIKTEDFEFIKGAYASIKLKYPYILEKSDWNEVTILTKIDGINFRAKIDKIIDNKNEIEVIDLKSIFFDFYATKYKRSTDGIRWALVKYIQEMNYDIQGFVYCKAIQTYLDHNGIDKDVVFKLLLASKASCDCKMVQFSSEMIESGRLKFAIIYPELQAFFNHGLKQIETDEII